MIVMDSPLNVYEFYFYMFSVYIAIYFKSSLYLHNFQSRKFWWQVNEVVGLTLTMHGCLYPVFPKDVCVTLIKSYIPQQVVNSTYSLQTWIVGINPTIYGTLKILLGAKNVKLSKNCREL